MTEQSIARAGAHDTAGHPRMWKFFVFSAIGGFMFFAPVEGPASARSRWTTWSQRSPAGSRPSCPGTPWR